MLTYFSASWIILMAFRARELQQRIRTDAQMTFRGGRGEQTRNSRGQGGARNARADKRFQVYLHGAIIDPLAAMPRPVGTAR
jgi:hypothetical protein